MTASKPSWYGPLMMVCSAVLFSTGGILCKLIPWSSLAINGVRCLIGSLFVGLYLLRIGHRLRFNGKVLFGAVCICGVTTLFVIANKTTTAANAIVLQYTAPIWIILMMALLFHKKPSRMEIITMVFVLAGILCFFLDSLSAGDLKGDMIALGSGFFYGGVFITNSLKDSDGLSSLFFGQLGTGLLLTPLVFRETDFSAVPLAAVLFLGIFQVGMAYLFLNYGTLYTSPVTASLICGIEPVLNPILVAVFWGETLKPLSLFGAAIVIISILTYNIISAKKGQSQETAGEVSDHV